jgi:hypothetical protein
MMPTKTTARVGVTPSCSITTNVAVLQSSKGRRNNMSNIWSNPIYKIPFDEIEIKLSRGSDDDADDQGHFVRLHFCDNFFFVG